VKRRNPTLDYFDVGHGETGIPWRLPRDSEDILYGKPGSRHLGYIGAGDITGRIDPEKRAISIAGHGPVSGRMDYAVSVLKMDFPGFAIYELGEHACARMLRRRNPAKIIFDTENPPSDADHDLGYAAVYVEIRGALRAWHVTNDAQKTIAMVKAGTPLHELGHAHQELGPGLYMSAAPQLWIGRATGKWDFLERLDLDQRQRLADALGKVVLKQVQDQYITKSEYDMANSDLGHFVDMGGTGFVIQVAGQPYNIGFWRPEFLEPLGIEPGKPPEVVEFLVQGTFAGFDDQPQTAEIVKLMESKLDGCFLRSGLVNAPQMVVWRNKAIVGMKRASL
jgi:hypothetical protein